VDNPQFNTTLEQENIKMTKMVSVQFQFWVMNLCKTSMKIVAVSIEVSQKALPAPEIIMWKCAYYSKNFLFSSFTSCTYWKNRTQDNDFDIASCLDTMKAVYFTNEAWFYVGGEVTECRNPHFSWAAYPLLKNWSVLRNFTPACNFPKFLQRKCKFRTFLNNLYAAIHFFSRS
jgi:hypothetical protein